MRYLVAAVVVLSLLVSASGCSDDSSGDADASGESAATVGSARSADEFCATFEREAVRLHDMYAAESEQAQSEADSNPLGALFDTMIDAAGAQQGVVDLFADLEDVAPEEIREDVTAVHDGLAAQASALASATGDPVELLGTALFGGLTSVRSSERVSAFMAEHCDLSFADRPDLGAQESPSGGAPVAFTTEEGWSYTFTPDVGTITIRFTKDTTTSPPGRARLRISISSSAPDFPGRSASTDVGRQAPGVHPATTSPVTWTLSDAASALLFGDNRIDTSWFPDGCLPWSYSSEREFLCQLSTGGGASQYESNEAPEAAIDAFLALNVTQTKPSVGVDLYSNADDAIIPGVAASITIAPDGTATVD